MFSTSKTFDIKSNHMKIINNILSAILSY